MKTNDFENLEHCRSRAEKNTKLSFIDVSQAQPLGGAHEKSPEGCMKSYCLQTMRGDSS